jgi:hypothetical protein
MNLKKEESDKCFKWKTMKIYETVKCLITFEEDPSKEQWNKQEQ